jgi:membrane protease subunit (stomatin/prohibitin family)
MGLIHAIVSAASGTLSEQWKEFFYCDALDENTLMTRGQKKLGNKHAGSNTKGDDNIISNGSVIAVADGQCMLIVEQGKVVELCAEPGEFTWDSSTEPSIFSGDLGEGIKATFGTIGRRFTFGGTSGKDQRIYYINTKELIGNKYGTANPVPFRVVDQNIGLDVDISVRCFGEYSYRIVDPILFYTNICANVADSFTRDRIDSQLKTELLTALQPAFARISEMGIRYSAVPGHTTELADALNEELSEKWNKLRGIKIVSFGVSSIKASDEDEQKIRDMQMAAALKNPSMAAATLTQAQAQAMKDAANNQGTGPAMAFMGMNMAGNAGGMNAQQLYGMGQQNGQNSNQTVYQTAPNGGYGQPAGQGAGAAAGAADQWKCPKCGAMNTEKFCSECGEKKPESKGGFCPECGQKYDAANPPKFCPNCGTKLQ